MRRIAGVVAALIVGVSTRVLTGQTVDHPLGVGGDVSAPVLLPSIGASVAGQAPARHGVATVALVIDSEGYVSRTKILHSAGSKELDAKAVAMARDYLFKPSLRAGSPVAVAVTVDVPASLANGEKALPLTPITPLPGVIAPKLLTHIQPEFPAKKPPCPLLTKVEIGLLVDEHGSPKHFGIRVPSQFDGFDNQALRAVQKYRFSPATKDGVAVEYPMAVTVEFTCYP